VATPAAASLPLGQETDRGIVFQELSGEQTGLSAILETWKAAERKRQGGALGSHAWWPWGVVAFDYDRDGALDLLLQQHGSAGSLIARSRLRDTGKLNFVNANPDLGLPSNGLAGCFKPLVWDFDGDGFLDLAFCDALPNTCFFNKQGKRFEPMGYAFAQGEGIRHVGDVNGDGYLDVYHDHARFLYDPQARKFRREGYPHPFVARPPQAVAGVLEEMRKRKENRFLKVRYLEGLDLDGDGVPDLVCAGFGSYGGSSFGRYLLGRPGGTWVDATEALGLPLEGTPVFALDLNGDGAADLLIAGAGLYLSDGKGRYELRPGPLTDYLKKPGPYLHQVYAADLNNDGAMDLVVSIPRGRSMAVFENRGSGDFRLVTQAETWDGEPVAVCDIDDDGLLDVCVGGPGDTVTIFLNRTARAGNFGRLYPRMARPNPYAVGTKLEVFRAGGLGRPGVRPVLTDHAHPDATPVHVGLGAATAFDLRVTFPGKVPRVVEHRGLPARRRIEVSPDGKVVVSDGP
jgi:hypothetical protein